MKHLRRYNESNVIKANNNDLFQIIRDEIDKLGHEADLNHIDVSEVTNMSYMFDMKGCSFKNRPQQLRFNGDISSWDVSNVKNMSYMFWNSTFNGDLSNWNVGNVQDMSCMFCESPFTGNLGNIGKWDVSNLTSMFGMFGLSPFTGDLNDWNVINVKNMSKSFPNTNCYPWWYIVEGYLNWNERDWKAKVMYTTIQRWRWIDIRNRIIYYDRLVKALKVYATTDWDYGTPIIPPISKFEHLIGYGFTIK